MQEEEISELEAILSEARFARYVDWAMGDRQHALKLYSLNCQVSESFYTPLHFLEICLRNKISSIATELPFGDPSLPWFDRPEFQLGRNQPKQVEKAKRDLHEEGKPLEPGRIFAALTFGYWTAFLGKDYDPHWQQGLNRIARRADGKGLRRKDLSEPLDRLRRLRNRVAHHEPILTWDLRKHHDNNLLLLEWIAPRAAQWCRQLSRFEGVYPMDRLLLPQIENARRGGTGGRF
jgi:hypothetical protein